MEEQVFETSPEDEPFSGTPCDPADEEMAAYLAEWEPVALHDRDKETVRRVLRDAPYVLGHSRLYGRDEVGELQRFLCAQVDEENRVIAAENARRDAEPEWPIDWRTFRG